MIALLGALWWWVLPVRKRLAIDNFRRAFPGRPATDLRRTVGEVAWGYVELAFGVRARVEGLEHVRPGSICLAGHGASWDLALVSGARHVPITIFVRRPSSRLAAWCIDRLRRGADLELLPPRGSMDAASAALARGRLVVFVLDQRHNEGVVAPFFGRPARTSAAFAAMFHRTRAPLVGCWPRRLPSGEHLVRFEPLAFPIPEERDAAIPALTRAALAWMEERIREQPESWWWLHDRWKQV